MHTCTGVLRRLRVDRKLKVKWLRPLCEPVQLSESCLGPSAPLPLGAPVLTRGGWARPVFLLIKRPYYPCGGCRSCFCCLRPLRLLSDSKLRETTEYCASRAADFRSRHALTCRETAGGCSSRSRDAARRNARAWQATATGCQSLRVATDFGSCNAHSHACTRTLARSSRTQSTTRK